MFIAGFMKTLVRRVRFFVVSCLSVVAAGLECGCSGPAVIDSAELIMNEDPAAACELLQEIDPGQLRHRKDVARYALVYTEVCYKNYLPFSSDSLILEAVRYYSRHKDKELQFRAYYSLGCVYASMSCLADAAVALSQAEKLADQIDDDFRKGLMYMQMGAVFFDSFDFGTAEPYFWKAVDCYDKCENDYYRLCALGEIGGCRMQMKDYDGAIDIYDQVIDWAANANDADLQSVYEINKLTCLVLGSDMEGAAAVMDDYVSRFGIPEDDSRSLCMMAGYYILAKDTVTSRYLLDKAWHCDSYVDSVNLYYEESLLEQQLCNYESALEQFRKSIAIQNRELNRQLYLPIAGAQRDYYRMVSELESVKARNRIIVLVSAIILLLISAHSLLLYRKRQTEIKIRDYLFAIDELTAKEALSQETIDSLNERVFELSAWKSIHKARIDNLNSKVRDILRQQFTPSDYLYTRFYEQLDDKKKAERLYREVKAQIDGFASKKNIGRLDAMLNETYDGLMDRLSSSALQLQSKDLLLLRFVLAGFSAKSIAALLNDSHQNVSQRKKRLIERINKNSPELAGELNDAIGCR